MSATPNNAGAGGRGLTAAPHDHNLDPPPPLEAGDGRDALQALLAFACIHEQAARRHQLRKSGGTSPGSEEDFRLDEVLRLVAARALAITGADGVAVALAEENAIVCRASVGKIVPDRGVRLDPESGFSGACLRSGQTVRCDDSDTDTRVNAQACRALGTRSMIAVPLCAKRRVIGLLEAFSSEPFGFNDSDVRSLNLLGELILAAIRPEEEDRLAELGKRILPNVTVAPPREEKAIPVLASTPAMPKKAIVEEKAAAHGVAEKDLNDEPLFALAASAKPSAEPSAITTTAASAAIVSETFVPVPATAAALHQFAEPELVAEKPHRSYSNFAIIAALILVAIGLGWAVTWKAHHLDQSISANTQPAGSSREGTESPAPVSPPLKLKSGTEAQVTGIHNSSSPNASTVVIDLEDQVQYEAHALENPPRIYFDLQETKMAPGLLNQNIVVDDVFLKRIRVAQPVPDVTRVVLETKGTADFSVKLDSNPYRLSIEVHKPGTAAKPPAGVPAKPSPSVESAPAKLSANNVGIVAPEFRVVLDAGHGGWDLGTVGRKGLLEKDLVLDIVQRLGAMLEKKLGAEVIYTRQDDSYLPLEKRAEIANVAKAGLFLSVHANYSDLATARGVETYYTQTYSSLKARTTDGDAVLTSVDWTGIDIRAKVTDSHRLAADVQQALYGSLATRNVDLRNRGVKQAQYVVLTGTQMPAVLAEVSFVSSPADEGQLQNSEYRQQIAEALFRGVAKYRNESKRPKLVSLQR